MWMVDRARHYYDGCACGNHGDPGQGSRPARGGSVRDSCLQIIANPSRMQKITILQRCWCRDPEIAGDMDRGKQVDDAGADMQKERCRRRRRCDKGGNVGKRNVATSVISAVGTSTTSSGRITGCSLAERRL